MTAAPIVPPAHPALAALAAARRALTVAGERPGWSMTDAEVVAALEELLGVQAQAAALTAGLVGEAEVRSLRTQLNQCDTRRWLRRRFRLSGREASRLDTVAEALPRWPGVTAALAAGRVTAEQGEVLARVLDRLPGTASAEERERAEALLVEQAATLDPDELAVCGRALAERLTVDPDVDDPEVAAALEREARRQALARHLRARRRADGTVAITAVYEALSGAELVAGLEAHAAVPAAGATAGDDPGGVADPRTKPQRLADALHELVVTAYPPGPAEQADQEAPDAAEQAAQDAAEQAAQDAADQDSPHRGAAADGGADDQAAEDQAAADGGADGGADDQATEDRAAGDQGAVEGGGLDDGAAARARARGGAGRGGAGRGGAGRGGAGRGGAGRGGAGAAAARVSLLVQWETLHGLRPGAGMLEDGTVLSPSQLLRALCDAAVLPVVFRGPAAPLHLGRRRRLFTGGQRAALAARDRGGAFPGCIRPPGRCTAHHMAHCTDGGPTDVTNGCLLCPYHHALVHREGWTARLARNGFPEFVPPDAYDLQRRPRQHLRYRSHRSTG